MQNRLFDIGWSNESKCQALSQRGWYRKAQTPPLSGAKSQRPAECGNKKQERRRKNGSGKEVLLRLLQNESQWSRGPFQFESGSLRSTHVGAFQQKGSKAMQLQMGSLLGMTRQRGACGWSGAQLDYDEDLGTICMGCMAPSRGRS